MQQNIKNIGLWNKNNNLIPPVKLFNLSAFYSATFAIMAGNSMDIKIS